MRVLFWSERFWPTIGGVGLSAGRLLPALQTRDYEFVVVTLREYSDLPEEDHYRGIPVYRLPFWSALTTGNVGKVIELRRQVTELKRAFAPDLVHVFFLGSSVLFHLQTLHVHHAPLLVSLDSALPERGRGSDSLAGRMLRLADWVTCVSTARLAEVRRLVPEIVPRSSCIPRGREVPSLLPKPLPFDAPRLLCLGRLVNEKGFELALGAFASILDCHPQVRLLVAGDGPARSALEQQALELGLAHAVDFVGWIAPERVPRVINEATIVVMPSRTEGLPHVALEAGMMARPVVGTRVGGLPEVVVHNHTGLLVEPEDSNALARAIALLLDHPGMAVEMGQAARARTSDLFSLERYVDAYDVLYRELAQSGR
jgi:glycogen(starch) synthase